MINKLQKKKKKRNGTSYFSACVLTNATSPYTPKPKITDGTHIWDNTSNSDSFKYCCIVYAEGSVVSSLQLFVDGVAEVLSVSSGNSTSGLYCSSARTFTGICTSYYFVLNYDSTFEKYPPQGEFKLYDYSSCLTNWVIFYYFLILLYLFVICYFCYFDNHFHLLI